MRKQGDIDDQTNKPEMIMFYNQTKGGVDTIDELYHSSLEKLTYFILWLILQGPIFVCSCRSPRHMMIDDDDRLPSETRAGICQTLKCEEEVELFKRADDLLGCCNYCPRKKNGRHEIGVNIPIKVCAAFA